MKTPANSDPRENALRAAKIVETLGEAPKSADVFEAFEELDALPPDVVKEAFEPWTGPPPDPERLDAATRKAHGFPPPALVLRLVRLERPTSTDKLPALEQEQLRLAGTAWDGLDLPAAERLAPNGGESTFAGTFERRTIVGTEESASFDVLLYRDGSGTIFRGDSTEIVGAIAYGVVEMSDRRAREGLQEALTQTVAKPLPVAVKVEIAEAPVVTIVEETTEPTPAKAPKKAAAKKIATKKPAAKKTATKKAAAEKPAAKKAAAKKVATKKPAAKKAAPAKATTKKAAAKKVAAKKVTAKKPAATKIAPKKPTAKKAAVTKTTAQKPVAKKATAKKPAAKKIAPKKPAPKKPAAKKATAKKPAAKKPASKKRAK